MTIFEHPGKEFTGYGSVLVEQQEPGSALGVGKFYCFVVGARGPHIPACVQVVTRKREIRKVNRFRTIVPDDDPDGAEQFRIFLEDCGETFDGLTAFGFSFVKHNHGNDLRIHVRFQ